MAEEHAVSLKLPTFWNSQPEVWLAQAEAQFNIRGITADETKYYYVVAALDQDRPDLRLEEVETFAIVLSSEYRSGAEAKQN